MRPTNQSEYSGEQRTSAKEMFEGGDWDFDQDFLDDVDEKSAQFYSQVEDGAVIEPVKRRKIEIFNDHSPPIKFESDDWTQKTGSNEKESDTKKTSRTNLILNIFNENSINESNCQASNNTFEKLFKNSIVNKQSALSQHCNNKPRKNLVLGILKTRDSEVSYEQRVSNNVSTGTNHVIGIEESTITNSRQNKGFMCKPNSKKKPVSKCRPVHSNGKLEVTEEPIRNSSVNARNELLLKTSKFSETRSEEKISQSENVPDLEMPQAQPPKKTTMFRKFPGPAGLIPDDEDISNSPVSYLASLEEDENEETAESTDSNISEYCSQKTKSLFTEGAWQLMLSDIPTGFLRGYDIATIKQTASTNCSRSSKIEFCAGLLEHIDHSHDNPPIVLRDFTDSIRGTLHRDIPLRYPGLLEPNVVILLRDVGLLRNPGTQLSNKYHILIPPSSLVAIYFNKGTIVRASSMESLLRNESAERSKDFMPIKCPDSSFEDSFRNPDELLDFGDMDHFYAVSSKEITNSQSQKIFINNPGSNESRKQKTSRKSPVNKVEERNSEKRRDDLLQALKRFAPEENTKKRLPPLKVNATLNADDMSLDNNTSNFEGTVNHSKTTDVEDNIRALGSRNCMANITEETNIKAKQSERATSTNTKHAIKSRLLQLKGKDVLTPTECSQTDTQNVKANLILKERKKQTSGRTNDVSSDAVLSDREIDSIDEILSQVDIDTISNSYS